MKIEKKYTCLGCGYQTLYAEADNAICVMCGWEDDPDSWEYPSEKALLITKNLIEGSNVSRY